MELKRIAMDTSKYVFTLHGVDAADRVVLRRELRRSQVEGFFAALAPTEVVLEACGASHHWGRLLQRLGHRVQLIPAQYVKPFVKRGKSDRIDAEAIAEAASRPGMRFVPVRAAEAQAAAMLLSVRALLVRQRTQVANALRGHAAEFGVVAAKGIGRIEALMAAVEAAEMPPPAKKALALLVARLDQLDAELAVPDRRLAALHPTAGRPRLGGISRAGNERLRQLLVLGATAVIRHARPGTAGASPWLLALLARKPRKLAAVALANKIARIGGTPRSLLRRDPVWAMMARGEAWRGPTPANA
jgi:transposase